MSENPEPVPLGGVSCPSGILLILDGGCAWLWSHDRPPLMPEFPFLRAAQADARDFRVQGHDAMRAAAQFGQMSAPYVCDRPGDQLATLDRDFADFVATHGLDAALEPLAARIPHRQRVDFVIAANDGGGVVEFNRMTAVALAGVARDRLLPIWAEPMAPGQPGPEWRRVWIELGQGRVASTRELGFVAVDEARLMAVDADALGAWDDHEPMDGKADVAFWGRDVAALAAETGATADLRGEEGVCGWTDMPVDEAMTRMQELMDLQSDTMRFAVDFRPHTHQFAVMAKVRAAPTQSGTLDLAGARLCMFMTTWGDGYFPVELDCDADGIPLRLRIELCPEEIDDQDR